MGKGIWGIDVSKFSAKAVRLEPGKDGTFALTRIAVAPYEGTDTGEPIDIDAQIKSALRQLKETCKIGSEPVVLSLPTHSTFNRLIKLPPVDDAKIPEIVRYEATSQIPFQIDEVIWDFQYVERQYQPGEEKEVILFAIKKDIVEQFLGNIAELGFNVEAVQFAPVALFNFLLRDQEVSGASVALDMGGDNTDLIVLDGTKFWVRNLPITGNTITKALQTAFNIPFEEAEKLKLKAGQSQQAQKIFNAIQPVLRDLVNEVNRSMGYYKSISKTSKFDRIILLGNSTRTLNFQKFISQSLQLPAARIQKLNTISVGGQVDAGELNESLGTLGTALGLALQGGGAATNKVNLLPPVYRQKKELKKKQPFVVAALACFAILVALAWLQQRSALADLKQSNTKAVNGKKTAEAAESDLKKAKQVDDVKVPLEQLVAISSERDLILKLMDEINPNIPNNGDEKLNPDQRLWVVDWKFEEKERKMPAPATAPGAMPPPPVTGKPLWVHRNLVATIEVVVTKRPGDQEAVGFITRTLLNYNPAAKAVATTGRPCAIKNKHWDLSTTQGAPGGTWGIERDTSEELTQPQPKGFPTNAGADAPEEAKFWRYRINLEIPVGEDVRKSPPAAEKGK